MKKHPGFFNYLLVIFLFMLMAGCAANRSSGKNSDEIVVTKIWDQAPHNAFTDLIRFNNAFYCTFREGSAHVKGNDGTARVLRSADGKNWTSVASLKIDGRDLRDPKLSVTPDNRLMALVDVESNTAGKVNSRKPYVSFSDQSGNNFSFPKESTVDPSMATWSDWVWRVTWHKGTGYAIDYQTGGGFYLLKTKDGSYFEKVSALDIDGQPNESTIRFDKSDKMYVLVRREGGDRMGVIATSNAPYKDWTFSRMNKHMGGPNFLFLNDATLCIGSRLYPDGDSTKATGINKHQTAVFISDTAGQVSRIIPVPSGGDTSYPGMVIHDGFLWFSYYSSHEGKTSIYLAKIPLKKLMP